MKNISFWKKSLERLLCLIFSICLISPLFFTKLKSGDISESEKRKLAFFPKFRIENSLNSNFYSEFKNWFEDHIGFRDKFIYIASWCKFNIFRQSPSEKVHVGTDNWYFYTLDNNLSIATENYPIDDELLEQILFCHKEMQKKLLKKGIEYVVILPTSKVSIYPEYLRVGIRKVIKTPVDMVADYIENNSDIKVVRMKDCLLNEKKSRQVYYKTDTHWSQAGGYAAYKEILRKFKEWKFISDTEKTVAVNFYEGEAMGEFESMMGIKLPKEKILYSNFANTKASVNQGEKTEKFKKIIEEEGVWHGNAARYYNNPEAISKSVMIWGDSMFESGRNVTEILAENCSELYYIFSSNDGPVRERLLNEIKPDVFVYESTERYTNWVPTRILQYLSQERKKPLNEYRNDFEKIEIVNGNIEVTVKNTTSISWDFLNEVRLGIMYNGNDSGKRVNLPVNKVVNPGDIHTFVVSEKLISDMNLNDVEFLMLQEGINYFENRIKVIN